MPEQLSLFDTPAPQPPPARTGVQLPAPVPGEARVNAPTPAGLSVNTPLLAAITAWVEQMRADHKSDHTLQAFGGDLSLFARFTGEHKNTVGQITTRDLDNWLQTQRASMSPKSYSRRVTSLKSFFRWLTETRVLKADPALPIIQHTVLSPLPKYLTEAEVQQALAGAEHLRAAKPDPRPYVLFTLLLQTGIKKGECLALVPNHVDFSDPAEPLLWVRYPDPQYRFKERKLRLDPGWEATYTAYRAYLDRYEQTSNRRLSPARKDFLFPWGARQLEYLLADIKEAAGLEKEISFDACRWTCAVRDARAGLDDDKLRQKLGLSKIQWREIGMKLKKLVTKGV